MELCGPNLFDLRIRNLSIFDLRTQDCHFLADFKLQQVRRYIILSFQMYKIKIKYCKKILLAQSCALFRKNLQICNLRTCHFFLLIMKICGFAIYGLAQFADLQ